MEENGIFDTLVNVKVFDQIVADHRMFFDLFVFGICKLSGLSNDLIWNFGFPDICLLYTSLCANSSVPISVSTPHTRLSGMLYLWER